MGILLLGGAFLAGCTSTQPTAINEDTVYSPPLRASITKPARWRFVSAAETRESQRAIRTSNQTLNFLVYQSAVVPFVAMERTEPISSNTLPSFAIYREPLDEDRLASSEKALGFEYWAYLNVMTGARVVAPTVHVKIAGEDYAAGRLRYPFKLANGDRIEIERRFWVHAAGLSAIIITSSYDTRDTVTADAEIEQIVRSIARVPTAAAK